MAIPAKQQAQTDICKAYNEIRLILENARQNAFRAVNFSMVTAYWHIGRVIVEEEQNGKGKAGYGEYLIKGFSEKLTKEYGRGFTESNLRNMRQFYITFKMRYALRSELTWTHYRLLMRVEDKNARQFYLLEAISNKWDTRTLDRQISSLLFERAALSRDKKAVVESVKGTIAKPEEQIKDPYVLEFLNLKEEHSYAESEIEQAMIDHMQEFLMELGRGFSFVARQKRISINNEHYYVDLVFYSRISKCLVLIDVKKGKFTHADAGQMNFYLNYFRENETLEGENDPIGLVLCSEKDNAFVKYALGNINNKIFASKYRLGLPSEEELRKVMNYARKRLK